ncbi:thioesterase II family protein [Vibrio gazogenes]|uniref:Thioesterase domain-containing protein n=1 Tax=Vibrio gazogenes TaxID=687 RepID=A0A1Z2SKX9_VIBGA|nr:thioesterase domain-containing protein [Vibrio gazogenes]ASA57841.1 hypothetical protein BSQ33_19130 [Vibrio gazogenes]
MNLDIDDKWLYCPKKNKNAGKRMFIFPHAGGTAQGYRKWAEALIERNNVEVYIVQLPGRAERMNEEHIVHMPSLVNGLLGAIQRFLDKPYLCFGHSLGCLVCFELMKEIRNKSLRMAEHMIFSAKRAPHLPRQYDKISSQSKSDLVRTLKTFDGTPSFILDDDDLLNILLPIMRNDFLLDESYTYINSEPLDIPLMILGADKDLLASQSELLAWNIHTLNEFNYKIYSGSHFYIFNYEKEILNLMSEIISDKLNF